MQWKTTALYSYSSRHKLYTFALTVGIKFFAVADIFRIDTVAKLKRLAGFIV